MLRRLLFCFTFFLGLAIASPVTAQDDPMPKAEKPALGDRDELTIQNKRFLKLRNNTKDTITVFLQYRFQTGEGWAWTPIDPAKGNDALSFEIEAGKDLDVKQMEEPIAASRMRIWATAPGFKWMRFKTKDIWLVPERNEDGDHVYFSEKVDAFLMTFALVKEKEEAPADAEMVSEINLPTEGEGAPPVPDDINFDVVPEGGEVPVPIVRDLAVSSISVFGGNAIIRVQNRGHVNNNVGRRLIIQKAMPGSLPFDMGPIGPLFHFGVKTFYVVGLAPGNYLAYIDPADEFPYHMNDKRTFTIAVVASPDLAVLPVSVVGGNVKIKVKNVGAAPFVGLAHLKVVKQGGGLPVDHGPIGPLAVNGTKTFPAFVLPAGNYKAFITPADAAPYHLNDQKFFAVAPGFVDLQVMNVLVAAGKAHVKIKNLGTADAPAGAHLKIKKMPGGMAVDHGPIGALAAGATKLFAPIPLAPGNYRAFITPGEAAPNDGNDFDDFIVAGIPSDLEVSFPIKVGGMVKATVKNNGPGNYVPGVRQWHIEKFNGMTWVAIPTMGSHVIPALNAGDSHAIQGTFAGPGMYRVRITGVDPNPGNDTKSKMLP